MPCGLNQYNALRSFEDILRAYCRNMSRCVVCNIFMVPHLVTSQWQCTVGFHWISTLDILLCALIRKNMA